MKVVLINNHAIHPYLDCYEMIIFKPYEVIEKKFNFRGDLVYMIEGFYGWKLSTRFHII